MSDTIIKAEGLGKKYTISHERRESYTSLRDVFTKRFKQITRLHKNSKVIKHEFWALKDISFEIKRGEAVGIIGRNGAGKSTLLKILSRIIEPTTGRIELNGRIASLLEVGTGFHPELTGRENIFLNGAILGMRRSEIKRRFDEIVEFSGVQNFIDTPVKRYSSGMYVRLAFSVAAHLEPEILVVDEVLAVGDADFQKKCIGKMEDVTTKGGRTVLMVSHNLGSINQLCSTGILLASGNLIMQGPASTIIEAYLQSGMTKNEIIERSAISSQSIFIHSARLLSIHEKSINEFQYNECIILDLQVKTDDNSINISHYKLLVTVLDSFKNRITSAETSIIASNLRLKIPANFLARGNYSLNLIIYVPGVAQYDFVEDCLSFSIIDTGSEFYHLEGYNYGTVFGNFIWEYI
jgi:lipopolysaccharide transport system ATP-binding protein